MSTITLELLLVLAAAACLGLLIGLSAMRLHSNKQLRVERAKHQQSIDQLNGDIEILQGQKNNAERALHLLQKQSTASTLKSNQIKAQQDAVNVHTRLQAQQINTLKSKLQISEEKLIRLQRDFASFRANKQSELHRLKADPNDLGNSEELPVLNKRVATGSHHAVQKNTSSTWSNVKTIAQGSSGVKKSGARVAPIIAQELDIPALAESELPDSVEELDFEIAQGDELNDRG